jgi:hypothetical protein
MLCNPRDLWDPRDSGPLGDARIHGLGVPLGLGVPDPLQEGLRSLLTSKGPLRRVPHALGASQVLVGASKVIWMTDLDAVGLDQTP